MKEKHVLAGKTVVLKSKSPEMHDQEYKVEDYWENVSGNSWMKGWGIPACLVYGCRVVIAELPLNDEVVYGKTRDGLGHIVHVTELGGELNG